MAILPRCQLISNACEEFHSKHILAGWLRSLSVGGWETAWDLEPHTRQEARSELTNEILYDYWTRRVRLRVFFNQTGDWCLPAILLALFDVLRLGIFKDEGLLLARTSYLGYRLVQQIDRECDSELYAIDFFRILSTTPMQLLYMFWMTMVRISPSNPQHSLETEAALPLPLVDFPCRMKVRKPKLQPPCVLDIGSHRGQDTLFYLSLGYRVVAVDMNPNYISLFNTTLPSFVAKKLLVPVHGAVETYTSSFTGRYHSKQVRMCLNDYADEHSHVLPVTFKLSFDDDGFVCTQAENVRYISCYSLLRRFGNIFYMKIDIESDPGLCLSRISELPWAHRPKYLSLEISRNVSLYDILASAGYVQFKIASQHVYYPEDRPFGGGSGLFGEDAVDLFTGIHWRSLHDISESTLQSYTSAAKHDWLDVHLKLGHSQ